MIKKIIVLLIIQIILYNKFDEYIYITEKNFLYHSQYRVFFENNNNNNIINLNNINILPTLFNNNIFNKEQIYYKLFNYSYIISLRFNIIKVEYDVIFYYKNQSLIIPSDLSLHYNLHLLCHINKNESNANINIDSIAYVYLNKCFKCIQYINIKEKINFGIILLMAKNENSSINFTQYFFNSNDFNYNNRSCHNNRIFYPLFVKQEYYLKNKNISFSLNNLYIKKPNLTSITNIFTKNNNWNFLNIYNHYFCFCRGYGCLKNYLLNLKNTTQICKYKYFLYLIEENKYLYNKTEYLLADFPGDFQSIDDAFPIFKKLISLKKHAYYMTINKKLLEQKTNNDNFHKCIIRGNFINGDFIEKYFTLFLKLKAVISGAEYISFNKIFFHIDYITFISLTHGINFFKADLFKTYYGRDRYHKLVISPSKKIISLATLNGWEEKDLIKICLPKWDKLDILKRKDIHRRNKSIFFFFTWRNWNKNTTDEVILKSDYFKNIIELMNNKFLRNSFDQKGITLNFCLHHMLEIYKDKLNFGNNKIKFIKQDEIFRCIAKSSLLVTDFSSIIFEFIYLNKPFVMYIPDGNDNSINKFYKENYINLINALKNGTIDFMNKYFDINQTVDKIIYYINNNYQLDEKLIEFYKTFNLTCGNNTMKFINYLEYL